MAFSTNLGWEPAPESGANKPEYCKRRLISGKPHLLNRASKKSYTSSVTQKH